MTYPSRPSTFSSVHESRGRTLAGPRRSSRPELYLRGRHWHKMRRLVLGRFGGYCERCGVARATEVHHRHYRTVGREQLQDLEPLCADCHRETHGL